MLFVIGIFLVSSIIIPLLMISSGFFMVNKSSQDQATPVLTNPTAQIYCSEASTINLSIGIFDKNVLFVIEGVGFLVIGIGLNVFSDYFQPVESRIELQQDTRNKIYNLIADNEGIHLREVCRKLGKQMGVIQYHIYVMERAGIITSHKDGRYRRFFLNLTRNYAEKTAIISLLKRNTTNEIITQILEKKEISHAELASILGITSQAITWHIKKVVKYDLIKSERQGKQKIYQINPSMEPLLLSVLNGKKST